MIWFLSGISLAQEIVPVAPGQCVKPAVQSFLLPEAHYDNCLKAAQNLPVCEKALSDCTQSATEHFIKIAEAMDVVLAQYETDDELVDDLVNDIKALEDRYQDSTAREARLRNQRNMAFAGGAGLGIGLLAVIAISSL